MTSQPPPALWGADALTAHLDAFRSNQFATFANKGRSTTDLISIDGLFDRFLNGAVNPRPWYPMSFMLRSHSAYRAAVSTIMGGQLYESQALMRLCLEHAAYGFYIGADQGRMERWLRRSDSDANRNAVRREFHNDKIRAKLNAEAPSLSKVYDQLYNRLIEFGAHPNEQGYTQSSALREEDGSVYFDTLYLQGDGLPLDLAMKTAAQVGMWPLLIMQVMYRERFELLGIKPMLDEIRQRF